MPDRPDTKTKWADNLVGQTVLNNEGVPVIANNRDIPPSSWQDNGCLWQVNLPYNYLNYQLYETTLWIDHLDLRMFVGRSIFADVSETSVTIGQKLGGTWTDSGTDTFAGQSLRLFTKTA